MLHTHLMAELKKRIKDRRPKNLDELRQISIEEWNKIPQNFIQKLFKNFLKRCKKIIESKGGRLEPVHLRQIRKEMKEENNNEEEIMNEEKNEENKTLKLKIVFHEEELIRKAKKEIAFIRKKIKAKRKELGKKEYISEKYRKKIIEIENYKFRVNQIKNYIKKDIAEYFNYFKKECDRQEEAKTYATTEDGEI